MKIKNLMLLALVYVLCAFAGFSAGYLYRDQRVTAEIKAVQDQVTNLKDQVVKITGEKAAETTIEKIGKGKGK
jgi:hypothetical protein